MTTCNKKPFKRPLVKRDYLKDQLNKRPYKRPHVMRDHLKEHM